MPIAIQRNGDGTYRVHHRPVGDMSRCEWLDGPVLCDMRPRGDGSGERMRRLYYVRQGLGETWIIFSRDYMTGKQIRYTRSAVHQTKTAAVAELRAIAADRRWADVTEGKESK